MARKTGVRNNISPLERKSVKSTGVPDNQGKVVVIWSRAIYLQELWDLYKIAKEQGDIDSALSLLEKIRKVS